MNWDILASIIFAIFSILMALQSTGYGLGKFGDPGAGFFPFFSSICIGILSLANLASQLRRSGTQKNLELRMGPFWQKAFYSIGFSLLYVSILWDRLGYIISTTLWLVIIFRVGGIKSWKKNLTITIVIAITSYLLFEKLGDCNLPKGLFAF